MMKLLIYLTLWSVSHATTAYFNRMATINHMTALNSQNRRPTAFRPGVMLHRPWMHQRLVQAASHRTPYVVYRNSPHRYAVKHYTTRPIYSSAWKTTRVPGAGTTEYEFVRAASASPQLHTQSDGGTGAIHTIPAPNLSLSEKPIVVIDTDNVINAPVSEAPKPVYEVTEKTPEPLPVPAKVEQPIGFSKATSLTTPELQQLVRNGAAFQFASDLGLSALTLPHIVQSPALVPQPFQQAILQQPSIIHPQVLPHRSIVPQQFTLQGLNTNTQEILHASGDGLVISPNALYQPDPAFLQKLQNQLMQRFPGIEFVPYAAEVQPIPFQIQKNIKQDVQTQPPKAQVELQTEASQTQEPIFLLQNEQITKQTPSSFVPSESKVFQRGTQEGTFVTLIPQSVDGNITDNQIEVTSLEPQNITLELVAAESQPSSTTIKYILETSTEPQKTTPAFYAPIMQNQGNVVTDGFYSAINEVRAAAALAQVDKSQENQTPVAAQLTSQENVTSTTLNSINPAPFFISTTETNEVNQTTTENKSVLGVGVPFAKSSDTVNVGYTVVSSNLKAEENKDVKVAKDGSVYAGQIVEATITEDQDFNREKAALMQRRAPIRLVVADKKETVTTTNPPPKIALIRTRMPPRSKLTIDDKTGEPVLRIYASYIDSPQKDHQTAKSSSVKQVNNMVFRKQDIVDNWKSANTKALDHAAGFDLNEVTQFGLKLRERSDDYVPLFDEYEE